MDGMTIRSNAGLIDATRFGSSQSPGEVTHRSEINSSQQPGPGSSVSGNSGPSFAETLKNAVNSVNEMQKQSDVGMQKLATGKSDNLHEVMIAAEKADIALKLMVQMRNKMIEAYQDIMKMQV